MPKLSIRALLLWAASVAIAVTSSTLTVTSATEAVREPRPQVGMPSPDALAASSEADEAADAPPSPTTGTDATEDVAASPEAPATDEHGHDDGSTSAPSETTASPTNGSAGTTTPPTGRPAPQATADDRSEKPSADRPPAEVRGAATTQRTATSTGGSARFRFEGERVEIVWTSPNDGYTVDVDRQGGVVTVTFASAGHTSRIVASVVDDKPQVEVDEG